VSRWHLGTFDDAVAAFEEALALAPADAAALNGLGVALLGQGRAAEAPPSWSVRPPRRPTHGSRP
jgi:Flp pilus assembly protein TadD